MDERDEGDVRVGNKGQYIYRRKAAAQQTNHARVTSQWYGEIEKWSRLSNSSVRCTMFMCSYVCIRVTRQRCLFFRISSYAIDMFYGVAMMGHDIMMGVHVCCWIGNTLQQYGTRWMNCMQERRKSMKFSFFSCNLFPSWIYEHSKFSFRSYCRAAIVKSHCVWTDDECEYWVQSL